MLDLNRQKYSHGSKPLRIAFLIVLDLLLATCSSVLALLILENFNWDKMMEQSYMGHIIYYSVLSGIVTILVFVPFKLYNSLWEFASVDELMHIVVAGAIVSLLKFIVNQIPATSDFPVSYPLISGILLIFFVGMSRMGYRLLRSVIQPEDSAAKQRTLLIGAGHAGAVALREFQTSEKSVNRVVCIVDDDSSKRGSFLRGVRVAGNRDDIPRLVEKYRIDEIVFAIPTASVADRREILEICQKTKCRLKKAAHSL